MALPPGEIGRRIRSLREQLGLSIADIASALRVDHSVVDKLEGGTLDPVPGDYILIVARVLKTDFRYLISTDLDDLEEETRKVFRALGQPTPSDSLAIRRFIYFCTCERELEELLSVSRASLPAPYPRASRVEYLHKDQGITAAREERQRLGLGNRPIQNVFEILRSQGVRLFRHRLEQSGLSGVTALHPRAGECILVNYEEDLFRQFFSAAHEYGHVLFDREEIKRNGCVVSYRYSKGELIEFRANAFAAEFLLPSEAIEQYPRPQNIEDVKDRIGQIAREYQVNTETVAIRMKEAGWITEKTLNSFKKVRPVTIPKKEKKDPDIPAGLSPTQVERRLSAAENGISSYYLELLRHALVEEEISFGRFAEMLDMSPAEAAEFVSQVGLAT